MRDIRPEELPDFVWRGQPTLHKVWTWGYQGKKTEDLIAILEEQEAIVFDARLKPFSRFDKQWGKSALQARLGHRYLHVPEWGNRNYKHEFAPKGVIMIADYEAGLKRLKGQLTQTAVVILCVCKNHHTCHRTTIANQLREGGIQVEEYMPVQKAVGNLVQEGLLL